MTSPAAIHMMRGSASETAQRGTAPLCNATAYEQMLVNGYTTGLELEVKVLDVEYESEDTESRVCFICLFYNNKISKMNISETFKGAHHVSLS